MTAFESEVTTAVDEILVASWNIRDGQVVPATENVALAGGGVRLTATILYADLADSTNLAMNCDSRIVAEVYKAFLAACSRIIRRHDGEIRSFDGDRVMGIFIGNRSNTRAAITALKINRAFQFVVKPNLEAQYEILRSGTYKLKHCCGVDTSEVLVVRGGIRNNNDLVWIGRAPNVAAKLSAIRNNDSYYSFITKIVYDTLASDGKLHNEKPMWTQFNWSAMPEMQPIYGSNWYMGL